MHGAVRVESYTDPATNLLEYAPWRVATRAGVRSFVPRSGRWQGPGLVVELGKARSRRHGGKFLSGGWAGCGCGEHDDVVRVVALLEQVP